MKMYLIWMEVSNDQMNTAENSAWIVSKVIMAPWGATE